MTHFVACAELGPQRAGTGRHVLDKAPDVLGIEPVSHRWVSREELAAADPRAQFILYHIPQVTAVPLSFDLVMGLRAAFPDRVIAALG